jgi:hypothetical protein
MLQPTTGSKSKQSKKVAEGGKVVGRCVAMVLEACFSCAPKYNFLNNAGRKVTPVWWWVIVKNI